MKLKCKLKGAGKSARRFVSTLLVAGLMNANPSNAMQSRIPKKETEKKGVYGLIDKCKIINKPCILSVMAGDTVAGFQKKQANFSMSIELNVSKIESLGMWFELRGNLDGSIHLSRHFMAYGISQTRVLNVSQNGSAVFLMARMDIIPGNIPHEAIVRIRK